MRKKALVVDDNGNNLMLERDLLAPTPLARLLSALRRDFPALGFFPRRRRHPAPPHRPFPRAGAAPAHAADLRHGDAGATRTGPCLGGRTGPSRFSSSTSRTHRAAPDTSTSSYRATRTAGRSSRSTSSSGCSTLGSAGCTCCLTASPVGQLQSRDCGCHL